MTRDYKKKGKGAGGGKPMGVGIMVGLLLGLCLALGVALYITKGPNPFVSKYEPAPGTPSPIGSTKTQSARTAQDGSGETGKEKQDTVKLDLDFYKILPGWEQAVSERDFNRKSDADNKEMYFLQVAAFPDPAAADNLKARLALSGIESKIQTAELPDGKVWHRVRIGPFEKQDELNASRSALKELQLEANLIKVRPKGSQ